MPLEAVLWLNVTSMSRNAHAWAKLTDEKLLDVRLCDLKLRVETSPLAPRVIQLYGELGRAGLRFRPHVWLSTEWFTPDGNSGIAIPFYLAHPRLTRLERRLMLEVDGGARITCQRILRHEAGHAINNAYRLHRRRGWQETFGKFNALYPAFYQPKPYSRSYVVHLDAWYAQSHPAEDFAETFAVWLTPRSRWRESYRGWSALAKLEYVDEVMRDIADRPAPVRSRVRQESIAELRLTLREYYDEKRQRYGADRPQLFDRDLHRLFARPAVSGGGTRLGRVPAAAAVGDASAAEFLRRHRRELRRKVAEQTGQYQYTVDRVLSEMIERCVALGLYLDRPPDRLKQESMILLAVVTMNYVREGHHRVPL